MSRKPITIVVLFAMLLLLPTVVVAQIPQGIVSISAQCKAIPSAVLTNAYVHTIGVRCDWPSTETSLDHPNWSYYDGQIVRTQKPILLRIIAGGQWVPNWVHTHKLYFPDMGVTLAVPWDPVLLKAKTNFIAEMGAHFGSQVVLVSSSCANGAGDDWNMPHSPADIAIWDAAGYTSQKLIDACEQIVDATQAAFPNAVELMAINGQGNLDPTPTYVADAVVSYAMGKYPGHFVAQMNSLQAATPWPPRGAWQILADNVPYTAAQAVGVLNGDLQASLTIAFDDYQMNYVEVYATDIQNPALQSVLAEFAH